MTFEVSSPDGERAGLPFSLRLQREHTKASGTICSNRQPGVLMLEMGDGSEQASAWFLGSRQVAKRRLRYEAALNGCENCNVLA